MFSFVLAFQIVRWFISYYHYVVSAATQNKNGNTDSNAVTSKTDSENSDVENKNSKINGVNSKIQTENIRLRG